MIKNRTMGFRFNRFGFAGIIGIVAILLYLILFPPNPINHDCAYFVQAAFMLSQGSVPYVDYIGMNPPLADYIHLFPVLLSRLFGISLDSSFYIFIGMLLFLMTFCLWKILCSFSSMDPEAPKILLIMGYLCLSLYMFRKANFGQREHLFIIVFIPYLFLRTSRILKESLPSWIPYVVGIPASLIFLLKPHFLIVILIMELWLIVRTHRLSILWKPEIILMFIAGFLYGLHFLFIPQEMKQAFFYRWIPFVAEHYDVYDLPVKSLLLPFPFVKTALILVGLMVPYGLIKRMSDKRLVLFETCLITAGVSHAMMVFQRKGWDYHRFPFMALLCISFIILLLLIFEILKMKKLQPLHRLASVIRNGLFLTICAETVLLTSKAFYPRYVWMHEFVKCIEENSRRGDRVTVLSTSMNPAYPTLLYADRLPGTRYVTAFPVAMSYEGVRVNPDSTFPYRNSKSWVPEERRFLEELGEDVLKLKPKIIIIHAENNDYGAPWGFIMDDYLGYTGWKKEYMTEYHFLRKLQIDNKFTPIVYRVYIRNGQA